MPKSKSKADREIFEAIASRVVDNVQSLLQAGADPNVRSADGQLPIDLAAKDEHTPIAKALLEAGADISEAGFGARSFAWLLGMSGDHKAAIEAEMREFYRPLLEDPKRKRWVEAIRAGDIHAAVKANKIPKDSKCFSESPEFLSFHLDDLTGLDWDRMVKPTGGDSALIHYATEAIPLFKMSPVESFVMEGNHEALEAALSEWASPARRCRRGISEEMLECPGAVARGLYKEGGPNLPLIGLAAMRKDERSLRALIRAGLFPRTPWSWEKIASAAREIAGDVEQKPDTIRSKFLPWWNANRERALAWMGVSKEDGESIEDMLLDLGDKSSELEEAVIKGAEGREDALRLIAEGAPPSGDSLVIATDKGDTELVRALFEAGAEPNFPHKSGVQMLARLSSAPLEALSLWMEYGACPLITMNSRSPDFGDGLSPSALYQAVWAGNQDMVQMLLEKSAAPVKIFSNRFGKLVSPMEDLARSRGNGDMAIFLRSHYEMQLFAEFPPGEKTRRRIYPDL